MSSLNMVQLIGNLGADPEVRSTNGGKVANLRLACSETWKDKSGERREKTEWVTVVIWSEGLAGVVERFLRKGSKIYVAGKLTTRKWQDQSGADRYSTEVTLQGFDAKLIMLDGKQDSGSQRHEPTYGADNRTAQQAHSETRQAGAAGQGFGHRDDLDDDVPFATLDPAADLQRHMRRVM